MLHAICQNLNVHNKKNNVNYSVLQLKNIHAMKDDWYCGRFSLKLDGFFREAV